MPLIHITTPARLLPPSLKSHIAKSLVPIYELAGLPAFYVNIFFHEQPAGDLFIGYENATEKGSTASKFVRLVFEHIARQFPDRQAELRFMDRVDQIIKPLFEERDLRWEYHVIESQRRLWRVMSLEPPPPGSEAEKLWKDRNEAVPWKQEEAGSVL